MRRLFAPLLAVSALSVVALSGCGKAPRVDPNEWHLTTFESTPVYHSTQTQAALDFTVCVKQTMLDVIRVNVSTGPGSGATHAYFDIKAGECKNASATFKNGDAIYLLIVADGRKPKDKGDFASGTLTVTPSAIPTPVPSPSPSPSPSASPTVAPTPPVPPPTPQPSPKPTWHDDIGCGRGEWLRNGGACGKR